MRILDRYILKSVLALFFICLFSFLFLYVIIDILSHLEEILRQQVSLSILKQYYLAYLPIMFSYVSPIACLLATLYTFGKLNRDNEIIAMRASGLSIFQVAKTIIVFGFVVSIFVFWVDDRFVPQSLLFTQKVKEQMESGAKKTQEKEREVINDLSMYGQKNRLFFISKFFPAAGTMKNILILEHDQHQNLTKKIAANKGVYKDGLWRFYQVITYELDENTQIKQNYYAAEEIMNIPETPDDFLNQRQNSDFMTIAQLDDYIWKLSRSGATTVIRNLQVDLYKRFSSPLTNIIIILLGIPFSLTMRKRATGISSIGISIMLGFVYFVLNAVSIALGKAGLLAPILSASLSHIVAFAAALQLINNLP